jgi:hypothetical protein
MNENEINKVVNDIEENKKTLREKAFGLYQTIKMSTISSSDEEVKKQFNILIAEADTSFQNKAKISQQNLESASDVERVNKKTQEEYDKMSEAEKANYDKSLSDQNKRDNKNDRI